MRAKSSRQATVRCARRRGRRPQPGFHLLERQDIDGLLVYRFAAPTARPVGEAELRRHVITLAHPEVLVPEVVTAAR